MNLRYAFLQAWYSLTHDRWRYALYTMGISFAVVLMFVEWGFRNALLDSNVLLIRQMNADLVMISRQEAYLSAGESVSRARLYQAAGVAGVRSVHPLYVDDHRLDLRNPDRSVGAEVHDLPIRVIGVDPDAFLLNFPELDPTPGAPRSAVRELKRRGRALYDRRSKPHPDRPGESVYGPLRPGTETDLGSTRIRLVGSFELGADFAIDGSLIVSSVTLAELSRAFAPGDPLAEVQFGLIRLEPGADLAKVQKQVRAVVAGGDVEVLTRDELIDRERHFWLTNTPIGYVFGFGMAMGFVVGLVICYQILASEVTDHLAEYATLKAIGHPGRYLSAVVLNQGLLMAGTGFATGLAMSALLYELCSRWTGLPMELSTSQVLATLLLTIIMCIASGLLALRKVQQADPAEVF
jgi:putative ABC transport system permease protein